MSKFRIFISLICLIGIASTQVGCKSLGRKKPGAAAATGEDSGVPSLNLTGDESSIFESDVDDLSSLSARPGDPQYLDEQVDAVYFAYDSAQVDPAEMGKIDAIAQRLASDPALKVTIEGHCDERGSRDYNLALGERRALAVRAALIGLGVASEKMDTISYGEEMPASMGHDEGAWAQNRRAEFRLFQ
jgi:peptidoglycan-associated lipoprotein